MINDLLLSIEDRNDCSNSVVGGVAAKLGRDETFDACCYCCVDDFGLIGETLVTDNGDYGILIFECFGEGGWRIIGFDHGGFWWEC